MNITQLLAEADPARDISIPGADWPAARQALGQLTTSPPTLTPPRRRPARRLLVIAASSAGLAAALVFALTAAPGAPPRHPSPSAGAPPGHPSPSRGKAGNRPPAVSFGPASTVAAVLHNAALAALQVPVHTPRPDQFVYTKLYTTDTTRSGGPGVIQTWKSVSGTRFGFIKGAYDTPAQGEEMSSCVNGRYQRAPGAPPFLGPQKCMTAPFAGFLPDLPTGNPAVLKRYLRKAFGQLHFYSADDYADQLIFQVGALTDSYYLTPAQRAALYNLLAQTPGLTVVHHVRNILGTTGVGIRTKFLAKGQYNTIVFDPKTYAPLGMVFQQPTATNLPGRPKGGEVLLKQAIVNKPGQLP